MKKLFALVGTSVLLAACNADTGKAEQGALVLETLEQKASYSIGAQVGAQLKSQQLGLDVNSLVSGISDQLQDKELQLSDEQIKETLDTFQKTQMKKKAESFKLVSDANLKEGEAFLAENAKLEGVITTESGLQYKVITAGKGPKPSAEDMVTVHYRGTLIDGTEFDSSYKRNEPATFPVQGVIAGWTEALQLMTEGSKWELVIPAALAYGERGAGGAIGANATLKFEVELLKADAKAES